MKKTLLHILTLSVMLVTLGIPVFSDEDFAGNEAKYENLCSSWTSNQANKEVCARYAEYLRKQKEEAQSEINDLKNSMNEIKGDINADNAVLATIQNKIESLKTEITATANRIANTETKIKETEVQITNKEVEIDEKDRKIKAYMVNMQGSERVNDYIGFIMGAVDFSEASRRLAGITQINEYNRGLILELNKEKLALEDTKQGLVFEKDSLVTLRKEQDEQAAQQNELAIVARQKVAALQSAYADLEAKQNAAIESQRLTDQKLTNINPSEPSSLAKPLRNFYVSATQWYYPGGDGLAGTKHLGVDMAGVPIGTPIYAPANGLVIKSSDTCASTGSWYCGSGFGNYVLLIMNVNGKIYGGLFGHMQRGSIAVSTGAKVTQGQRIGSLGNSGNSTGPHLHNELYYLGNDSVEAAYNRWYVNANIVFDTGSSSSEYSRRCSVNGNTAPCRLNAADEYDIYLGYRQ